ncbi:DNA ligase 1-like [Saccostrea cucullata]|uniref:DNA ligase 1-like n=1 Tax=Saccostrea cuccullata TaxID=36930 RepID=UPI002ED26EB1
MESSNSKGFCKKKTELTMIKTKLTMIKTELKNKYVVEAYERLKEKNDLKSLKQLLFSCLCRMEMFTSYFVNEDNVFEGVMNVMEIVQNFRNQEKRFHGNVSVPGLDRFMNSYFHFWIQAETRSKCKFKISKFSTVSENSERKEIKQSSDKDNISKSTTVSENFEGMDAEKHTDLQPNERQNERIKKELLLPQVLYKKFDVNEKLFGKLYPPQRTGPKISSVSHCREKSFDETSEDEQNKILGLDFLELQSTKIRNRYVLETFNFKKGDFIKIYDCLCEWEGIAQERVHLQNFAAAVRNTVREADRLKKSGNNLYDSFLREFFKFPLNEKRKGSIKEMGGKEREKKKRKREERNKSASTETQTPLYDEVKEIKKEVNVVDTTVVKKPKKSNEETMKQKVMKVKIGKVDGKKSAVRRDQKCRTKPKNSNMAKKRKSTGKRKRRLDVLELQMRMKLQQQRKLYQKIKRQNNLLVRQRKHIRVLKRKLAGVCSTSICKGVQCSLLEATPKTLLVRVLKP